MESTSKETSNESKDSEQSKGTDDKGPTTLKQIYGMLCWLLIDGNAQKWANAPLEACQTATQQCPHLANADAQQLLLKMQGIACKREEILQTFKQAENVPKDTRVFAGGPLFAIVDYALSGKTAQVPADEIYSLLQIHGVGKSNSGPIRNTPSALRKSPYSPPTTAEQCRLSPEHPLMQRARRLTRAEIDQMKDEMAIRREIALRDAKLLADWTALKRRELEIKELKLREFIQAHEDGTLDSLSKLEQCIKRLQDTL
ncbi:hypothetical protein IWW36_003411 [Coemansia brasiliensis]|uniref:Uncharacterized protein n=1 Tax=Coemansia brasiliensis TaxID=2650707 RepID=A0A9W8IBP0_9FUNG|nr:hypothetical protein IWW36_003411 [Coemansia brasiliensis]